jgi:hypothetical protein
VAVILPAGQSTHVPTDEAPVAAEWVPGAQLPEHVEAPAVDAYVPAAQSRQSPSDVAAS